MTWANLQQTRTDILGALGLPLTAPRWVEWVERAMTRLEDYNGQSGVDLVEGYVTRFQAAETAANTASGDAGIKKLDVIEYFPGGSTSGYETEMKRYRSKLLDTLFWEGEKAEIRRMSSASFGGSTVKLMR